MTAPKTPSPSSISRLLAGAGFERSELYPKGLRRGEVRIEGYHVQADSTEPGVRVTYWALPSAAPDLAANRAMLVRYAEALSGYEVDMRRHHLIVTAKAERMAAEDRRTER